MSGPTGPTDHAGALRLAGVAVVVCAAITRMVVGFEPFPAWDADPFVLFTPGTALGPSASMILDLVSLLGAAMAMAGVALAGAPACIPLWLAVAAGCAAVAFHSLRGGEVAFDHARVGSQWAAAMVGGAAAWEACRDGRGPRSRRLALAALVAAVMMLVCKGALQLLIEHPQTVAMYRQNRDAFFAAQGWSADSAAARAFEHRLTQPEASGWFSMANVYASWGALASVACAGLMLPLGGARSRGAAQARWVLPVLGLGALAGLAGVAMADSKGGWVATGLGFGLLAATWLAARRAHRHAKPGPLAWLGWAPLACVAAALAAIILRGALGDRLHDLSLLFRWYYTQGAARVLAAHPLAGVGPDGFKDAYMLLKPPQSPEEVTSPHGLLWDFASTLGVGGLCWAGTWLWWVWRAGRPLAPAAPATDEPPPHSPRSDIRVLFLMLSIPTVVGAVVEVVAATPEAALSRLAGLVLATAVGSAAAARMIAVPRSCAALACAAACIAAHTQIELTAIWVGSAPAFFALFGLLASSDGPSRKSPEALRRTRTTWVVTIGVLGFAVGWALVVCRPVQRWERSLAAALDAAQPAIEARVLAQTLGAAAPADKPEALGKLSDHLSSVLGRPVGPSEDALRAGLEDAFVQCGLRSLLGLEAAAGSVAHPGTQRAVSRLALQLSTAFGDRGDAPRAGELADRAVGAAEEAARLPMQRAASLGWLGTVHLALADARADRVERELAYSAWSAAASADPCGITWPAKLARLASDLGRPGDASSWAARALRNDELAKTDPRRRLPDGERAALEALARGS